MYSRYQIRALTACELLCWYMGLCQLKHKYQKSVAIFLKVHQLLTVLDFPLYFVRLIHFHYFSWRKVVMTLGGATIQWVFRQETLEDRSLAVLSGSPMLITGKTHSSKKWIQWIHHRLTLLPTWWLDRNIWVRDSKHI